MKLTICNICGRLKKCITNMEYEAPYEQAICPECLGIPADKLESLEKDEDQ